MSYLDCAQYDCCHNKAGCCCLGGINVRHTGPGDAVCGSYRNSEGYGNVATDNQRPRPRRISTATTRAAAIWRGAVAVPTMSALTSAAADRPVPPAPHVRPANDLKPNGYRLFASGIRFFVAI